MTTEVATNFVERRTHVRHIAKTRVQVISETNVRKMCTCENLSATGVLINTEGMALRRGSMVTLTFTINLGVVNKIHRRTAKVIHVTKGRTGFAMESFTGNKS
jgi:hypothetical protein